jgi:Ca2+-binding RTX toxin-like protein
MLMGGSEADTLIGGRGLDQFWGGGGSDLFVFKEGSLSYAEPDAIYDFWTGDLIDLHKVLGKGVHLRFAPEGSTNAGDVVIQEVASGHTVEVFGDGGQSVRFVVYGSHELTEADFLI